MSEPADVPDEHHHDRPDDTELPHGLDDGLAAAYGGTAPSVVAPSVLARIGELAGSTPRVHLRDEPAGDTPMLRPLAPTDRTAAGKYVVQGELGRGGVGAVHRGHDQDLGRDVALKFLHERYKDDPSLLHRFVEEAQIGGQLQHPGIVPVYDLGLVDGRPFFAMKLVKGQALAKKLAEREKPTDDRRRFLSIFEDVCQTLAYAHVRGVVHRDLKPANIMIGSFGEVQVVDWGMGKVLRQGGVADEQFAAERRSQLSVIETVRSAGHGTQSLVGSVMGTPAYMPPEQARGDVEAMDERSDVFALGAILCEILTGDPPYVGEHEDLIEMAAMARLSGAHARLAASGAEPELIELTTRCLMPAPAARPRSAEAVAKAVHDHLAAVEARVHEARLEAAEAKGRAASLKRTQRLGITLTVVIALGLAASLWFWRAADAAAANERDARLAAVASAEQARVNEQRAVDQTAVAERELARAVEIKTLITDMLKGIRPDEAQGEDVTLLRRILDRTAARLADGAIVDEQVAAELHAVIGSVYTSLGLFAEAEQHVPMALAVRERLLGGDHERTLGSVESLGILRLGQGRFAEAEAAFDRAVTARTRLLGAEHADTLRSMANLAAVYSGQGRDAESEALGLRILDVQRRVLGEEHAETLATCQNLATQYASDGRFEQAEATTLRVVAALERTRGVDHPQTLHARSRLADLYEAMGRYAEAEQLFRRSLEQQRRVFGDEHPTTLASQRGLANLLMTVGRHAEALPLVEQALQVERRRFGDDHPDTLRSLGLKGTILLQLKRLDAAEPCIRGALDARVRLLGETHPNSLASLGNLAVFHIEAGQLAEAERVYMRLQGLQERALGAQHPNTIGTLLNLANLYERQGRPAQAEATYREAVRLQRQVLGDSHPTTAMTMMALAHQLLNQRRVEEAEPFAVQALAAREQALGADHEATLAALATVARVRQLQDRLDLAEPLLLRLIAAHVRVHGNDHEEAVGQRGNLAMLYHRQGRAAEAEPLFLEVLASQRRQLGPDHLNTLGTITNLGNLYNSEQRFAEAAAMFELSLPGKQRTLGPFHPWTGYALKGLVTAYRGLGRDDDALRVLREAQELVLSNLGQGTPSERLNQVAWALLTNDEQQLRDPARALGLARRAVALDEAAASADLWQCLDTLALAQFETGDAAAAAATQRRALATAPAGVDAAAKAQMAAQLQRYEAAAAAREPGR